MKKLVSFIIVLVIILSVAVTPAFAGPYFPDKEYDWLYLDKFLEYEIKPNTSYDLIAYDEYYYHKDANGDIDWVWVVADVAPFEMLWGPYAIVLNDKVLGSNYKGFVFVYGYGIYDVKEDKFIDILYVDISKYDGMAEYIDKNIGSRIGDADRDKELTVLDATLIQRAIAKLCDFNPKDYYEGYGYLSDMDRDGERTVIDATLIQEKLAKK